MRAHCKWALMAFIPHLCHLRSNLPFSHFLSSLVPSKITQQLFPQCREAVRGQQGFVDRERSGVSGRVELTLDPDFFFFFLLFWGHLCIFSGNNQISAASVPVFELTPLVLSLVWNICLKKAQEPKAAEILLLWKNERRKGRGHCRALHSTRGLLRACGQTFKHSHNPEFLIRYHYIF